MLIHVGSSWWLLSPPLHVMGCHSFLATHQQRRHMFHNLWPTHVANLAVENHFHISRHRVCNGCQTIVVSYATPILTHGNHVCEYDAQVWVEVIFNNDATYAIAMCGQLVVATTVIIQRGRPRK